VSTCHPPALSLHSACWEVYNVGGYLATAAGGRSSRSSPAKQQLELVDYGFQDGLKRDVSERSTNLRAAVLLLL